MSEICKIEKTSELYDKIIKLTIEQIKADLDIDKIKKQAFIDTLNDSNCKGVAIYSYSINNYYDIFVEGTNNTAHALFCVDRGHVISSVNNYKSIW